ncbi:MAG: hypothetical protein RR922_06215 [Clostridia bacterium]
MNIENITKAIDLMQKQQLTLDVLELTAEDLRCIKNIGHRVKYHYDPSKEDFVYYIVPKDDMAYIKISDQKKKGKQKLNILEISDLHAGSDKFDYDGLNKTLKEAVKRKVQYVHISGDLIDGHNMYRSQDRVLEYNSAEGQIDMVFEILSQYDLWYIASMGNHDASYSIDGSVDPLKLLERKMAYAGKKFTYLDAYEANIIHAGVVFRLVHLAGAMARSKTYKGQKYLANVFDSSLNDVKLGQKDYNLRSVQGGHYHVRNTFEVGGIDFIMPGNYQHDGDLTKRMGITGKTGGVFRIIEIYKGQIIKEIQEFYKVGV